MYKRQLLIGAAAAGLFGILIGIPVLRLRGDYLAIVTLAFGEIIKNVINVFFIGRDRNGLHFSMKDSVALNLDSTGEVIVNGPQGINGTPKDSTFLIGMLLLLIALIIDVYKRQYQRYGEKAGDGSHKDGSGGVILIQMILVGYAGGRSHDRSGADDLSLIHI